MSYQIYDEEKLEFKIVPENDHGIGRIGITLNYNTYDYTKLPLGTAISKGFNQGLDITIKTVQGLIRMITGETKAVAGFIMGSRDLHIMIPKFDVNQNYYVHVQSLFCDNNLASFECEIYDSKNKIVATGNLNAFRPDDINDFMENGNE